MLDPSLFPRQAILVASRYTRSLTPARLVLPVLTGGAALVFIKLLSELFEGEDLPLDRAILLALRRKSDLSIPIGPGWIAHAVGDITSLGGITVLGLMTLAVTLYLMLAQRRAAGFLVLLSVGSGWLLSNLLKIGIARPRPDIVPHLIHVSDLSFPSGHAMLSAVTYLTLGLLLGEVQKRKALKIYVFVVAVLLTIMIGLSRIYLGVHYPSDVLGGWCAGAVWAAVCWFVSRRFISDVKRG